MTAPLTALLDTARTPAQWAAILAQRGFDVSERTLRTRANQLGACHRLGRAMIITPDQLDLILCWKDQ